MAAAKAGGWKPSIRTLWAIAKSPELGMSDEDLHALVYRETGKESIRALTQGQLNEVARVLQNMRDAVSGSQRAKRTDTGGNRQTAAQRRKIYALSRALGWDDPSCSLEQLCEMYLEEGGAEGVRGDVAFAQSLHETGFFRYGGIVRPQQNNFAGIGALNGNNAGQAASFPNPRTGIRAQIQHLKAYASTDALVNPCVDPRFSLVVRGSAPYVEWLGAADNPSGKGWAVPGKGYGEAVNTQLRQIIAQETPQVPAEPVPQPQYPEWQTKGLSALVEAGVIESPEYWEQRLDKEITVGEVLGVMGRLLQKEGS